MQTMPMTSWSQRKPVRRGAAVTAPSVLEIIKNLPSACLVRHQLQDDLMSQYCGSSSQAQRRPWYTIYHIPDCKPYLARRRENGGVPFGPAGFTRRRAKRKRPAARPGVLREKRSWMRQTVDCATTTLRQGLSTAIASAEARMLAPAAMMNTLSQLPDDCCM